MKHNSEDCALVRNRIACDECKYSSTEARYDSVAQYNFLNQKEEQERFASLPNDHFKYLVHLLKLQNNLSWTEALDKLEKIAASVFNNEILP